MIEMIKAFADHFGRLPDPLDVHVTTGDLDSDGVEAGFAQAAARPGTHELAEDSISAVSVGEPKPGQLKFFLDGIQRSCGPVTVKSPVPFLFGFVSAVIRERGSDKMMHTSEGAYTSHAAVYASCRLLILYDHLRGLLDAPGIRIIDAEPKKADVADHPLALVQEAWNKMSTKRGDLESQLVYSWLATHAGGDPWLLVDGGLPNGFDKYESANVIGVTKSHGTQYFPWLEQQEILNLKVGERSGVFIPIVGKPPKPRPVYTWYLRMRSNEGQDMYFGLVRVEAAKCQQTLEMADEISRWLLAERSPLSLPDARWDKMIYPIKDCEQYLKSVAPSKTSLDATMIKLIAASRAQHRADERMES